MLPKFVDMLNQLVAEPSISSTTAEIDRSNLRVVEHLANWLNDLGFATELMPLPRATGQSQFNCHLRREW